MAIAATFYDLSYTPEPPDDGLRQCSVRGCHQMVPASANAKMCDTCRGRHRIYATTKRLRRKMEKAALQCIVGRYANQNQSAGQDAPVAPPGSEGTTPNSNWQVDASISQDPTLDGEGPWPAAEDLAQLSPSEWEPSTIDPNLYEASLPNQRYPIIPLTAPSSSSELANALTLPTYYRPEETVVRIPEGEIPTPPPAASESIQSPASQSTITPTDGPPPRYCSVKGCKSIIPGFYEFKMCPSCRTRYRGYGTTKRRKWKAEREAFDREMTTLRNNEDQKRKDQGLPPLADNPEELRSWEMSVLDETIPLPAEVLSALEAAGIRSDGTINVPSVTGSDGKTNDLIEHFTKVAEKVSTSTTGMSGEGSSLSAPSLPTLSARMCTVSHCHKILPGYYRYKRCEQHRLQNRHHSKLKRVREKVVKALGPEDGAQVMEINPALAVKSIEKSDSRASSSVDESAAANAASYAKGKIAEADQGGHKEEEEEPAGQAEAGTALLNDSNHGVSPSDALHHGDQNSNEESLSNNNRSGKSKRRERAFSCITEGCQNLLPLEKRWKHCDLCRLVDRRRKAQEKSGVAPIPTAAEAALQSQDGTVPDGHEVREKAMEPVGAPQPATFNPISPAMAQEAASLDIQQQQRLRTVHGDDHGTSDSVPLESQPDAEMEARIGSQEQQQQHPRDDQIQKTIDRAGSAGLRMVNITPQVYENTEVPFRWSNATVNRGIAGAGDNVGIASTTATTATAGSSLSAGIGKSWEATKFITTTLAPRTAPNDKSSDNPNNSNGTTLTFKEYRPTAPETALSRFLAQHPYVTVETFKSFLEKENPKAGADNGGGDDSGTRERSLGSRDSNGTPQAPTGSLDSSSSSFGCNETSSETFSVGQIVQEQAPPSAGVTRLDIPRVATSTAESFRYYKGPRDAQQGGEEPTSSSDSLLGAAAQAGGAPGSTSVATDKPTEMAATPSLTKKRKSKDSVQATVAASVPTNVSINIQPTASISPYPGYAYPHLNPQYGYPSVQYYFPSPAYPYMYPASSPSIQAMQPLDPSIATPHATWAITAGSTTPSYPFPFPPSAFVQPSYPVHYAPAVVRTSRTAGSGLPYPYTNLLPVPSMIPVVSSTAPSIAPVEPLANVSGEEIFMSSAAPPQIASERPSSAAKDTKFSYYHYGIGSTDSPEAPEIPHRKKRRTVDPAWIEKMKQRQLGEQRSAVDGSSLADNAAGSNGSPGGADQALRYTPNTSTTDTIPLEYALTGVTDPDSAVSNVSAASKTPAPLIAGPPAARSATSERDPQERGRTCHGKNCHKVLPSSNHGTLCDRCKTRIKKHQEKTKAKFKLIPYKSIVDRIGSDILRSQTPVTS